MSLAQTNFRAEDMPGNENNGARPAKKAAPKKAEKATPAKAKKESAPETVSAEEGPAQTDTETHGVGPSTVEGQVAEAADDNAEVKKEDNE